jgi:hypothetical protein
MPPLSGLFRCKAITESSSADRAYHVVTFADAEGPSSANVGSVRDRGRFVVPAQSGLVVGRTCRITIEEVPGR